MNKGIANEYVIIKAINNKKYLKLNDNLKSFIKFIFPDIKDNDILECKKIKTLDKADIYIKHNNIIKNISIKSGNRVSVHSENVKQFITFLKRININEAIIDYLLLYHYGDDTTNGSGKKRMSAEELKIKYEREIRIFNKYVNYKNIIKKIINRCLFEGTSEENIADYVYYGNSQHGIYASKEEIIDYMCNNRFIELNPPHFSALIYQNLNRNLVLNPRLETHRYYCQLKWPSIAEILNKIRSNDML